VFLYPAGVLFGLTVVVDADQQQAVSILRDFGGILLAANLRDGTVGILVDQYKRHANDCVAFWEKVVEKLL